MWLWLSLCPCRWVMLKNVHLAPGWLMQLEKKLHSLQPHACFRLFLTMEINPKVRACQGARASSACSQVPRVRVHVRSWAGAPREPEP